MILKSFQKIKMGFRGKKTNDLCFINFSLLQVLVDGCDPHECAYITTPCCFQPDLDTTDQISTDSKDKGSKDDGESFFHLG